MYANTTIETLTPEQFAVKYLPMLRARDAHKATPDDYFVRNTVTGKLELHIGRKAYRGLSDEQKQSIRDAFYWGRNIACWTSRADSPDFGLPQQVAESIGLYDAGETSDAPAITRHHEPLEKTQRRETISPVEAKPQTTKAAEKFGGFIDGDEIEHALLHGSGFEGGKIRIAAFYSAPHTPDEAKRFLKEEYGTGGHSHTFLNGASGFVDYDGSGMKIRVWKQDAEVKLSWITVDSYLRGMIREGVYLTDEEQAKYKAAVAPFRGKAPMPMPRMHYPPVKQGA